MFKKFSAYLANTSGATGVEYGLILSSVGLTIATGSFMLGNDINAVFEAFSSYINAEIVE